MARKRAAKSPSPPPPASSEETDSRSRSEQSEDEEASVVSPPLLIRNPPQEGEDSETTDDDDEETGEEGEPSDSVEEQEATANGGVHRGFEEMCELYPYMAEEVKELEAKHPGVFKGEFGKIDDRTARAMDAKIKRRRIAELKVVMRGSELAKEVIGTIMELLD